MSIDAALEAMMDRLVARTGMAVALQHEAGWWTGMVWEAGGWNMPSGGPNALSAAANTFLRIAGRTKSRLTRGGALAEYRAWLQEFGLIVREDGRIVAAEEVPDAQNEARARS